MTTDHDGPKLGDLPELGTSLKLERSPKLGDSSKLKRPTPALPKKPYMLQVWEVFKETTSLGKGAKKREKVWSYQTGGEGGSRG